MSERETFTPPETERKIITLDDIMDPNRSIPEANRRLILAQEQEQTISSATSFSHWWKGALSFGETPEHAGPARAMAQRFFREHLKQGVLIDLGGGETKFSFMRDLAKYCNAFTYVNVDLLRHPGHIDPLHPVREEDVEDLHEIEVSADMLDFVSRMKDNSANFAINGIDEIIIHDQKYRQALAQELVRATRKGGIIFGTDSDIPLYLFSRGEKAPLKFIPEMPSDDFRVFVFEKVE